MTEPFQPKPRRKRKPRETGRTGTEAKGRKFVKAQGGESFKWRSPGRNGVPDQIELYGVDFMLPRLREHMPWADDATLLSLARDLLADAIRFTEYKAPGKLADVSTNQLSAHRLLRDRGFHVDVIDHERK